MQPKRTVSAALAAVLAGGLSVGALAQTTTTSPGGTNTTTTAGTLTPNAGNNAAAASGDTNQAVATTSANAATPAKGANSFTQGQAQTRIASAGFTNVADLKKDADGIWHGTATKDGKQVQVWLDYKGNVGQL